MPPEGQNQQVGSPAPATEPAATAMPPTPAIPDATPAPSPAPTIGSATEPFQQQPRNPNSSQNSLLFSEIRDNMVIMNDGSFRAVVACESINFDLMSDREREGVEYSYQSFLNSLYFDIQILVRSQRVDIGPYLDRLEKVRRDQDNMLLGVLMEDYINFIGVLAEEANIMNKQFYVVVPYYPSGDLTSAVTSTKNLLRAFRPSTNRHITIDQAAYDKAKTEVSNRVNVVVSGLFQMGVRSVQLPTQKLAELYYNFYNPDTAVREPLIDFSQTASTYISKGQGNAPQPHLERQGL